MTQQQLNLLPVNEPIKVTEEQFKKIKSNYDGYVFFRECNGEYFIKIRVYKISIVKEISNIINPV